MKIFKTVLLVILAISILTSCSLRGKKSFETGISNMDMGEYASAEENVRKAVDSGYKDDNAELVYKILHTYNRTEKAIKESDFDKAVEEFDKIPPAYDKYSIGKDVDKLKERLDDYKEAKDLYDRAVEYFNKGMYSEANTTLALIKKDNLSNEQIKTLSQMEQTSADKEKLDKKNEDYSYNKRVNELFENYIYGLTSAINQGNYDCVKDYILEGSSLCTTQKKLVKSLFEKEVSEGVDSFSVDTIKWISETECKITTSERYSIYSNDGYKTQSFNYKYDIVEKDGRLYLTTISK